MQKVAHVACQSRQPDGHLDAQGRAGPWRHRAQLLPDGALLQPAKLELAGLPIHARPDDQPRQGLAQVAHVQRSDAPRGVRGQRMHRPASHPADPSRPEASTPVQQGRPDDAPVATARTDGILAIALGVQEAAAYRRAQTQCRDVHQADSPLGTGRRQRRGRKMVHAVVGFAAALAKDPDAVHDRVDAFEHRFPASRIKVALQAHPAEGTPRRGREELAARLGRIARSDHHIASRCLQRGRGVPPDETRPAKHQHTHRPCRVPLLLRHPPEPVHEPPRPVSYFCLDRNV